MPGVLVVVRVVVRVGVGVGVVVHVPVVVVVAVLRPLVVLVPVPVGVPGVVLDGAAVSAAVAMMPLGLWLELVAITVLGTAAVAWATLRRDR